MCLGYRRPGLLRRRLHFIIGIWRRVIPRVVNGSKEKEQESEWKELENAEIGVRSKEADRSAQQAKPSTQEARERSLSTLFALRGCLRWNGPWDLMDQGLFRGQGSDTRQGNLMLLGIFLNGRFVGKLDKPAEWHTVSSGA